MSLSHDDSLIIRIWYEIALNAIDSRASDIHIEAGTHQTLVRFRIDGLLQISAQHPQELHERLITRIKILARLDIAEKRLPQDGRLSIGKDFSRPDIDCRVSLLPTLYGEKAVIRILPNQIEELALDQLGLLSEQFDILKNGGKSFFLDVDLVGGLTMDGTRKNKYEELNSDMDFGSNLMHFAGVGSGMKFHFQGSEQTNQSYVSWALKRFAIYYRLFYGISIDNVDVDDKIFELLKKEIDETISC